MEVAEIVIEAVLVAVSSMRGLLGIDHGHVAVFKAHRLVLGKSRLRWAPRLRNRGDS